MRSLRRGENDFVFIEAVEKAARSYRIAPCSPIGADIKIVISDPSIDQILARQLPETDEGVRVAQIDLDFVRKPRLIIDPFRVPKSVWVAIDRVSGGSRRARTKVGIVQLLAVNVGNGPVGVRNWRDRTYNGHIFDVQLRSQAGKAYATNRTDQRSEEKTFWQGLGFHNEKPIGEFVRAASERTSERASLRRLEKQPPAVTTIISRVFIGKMRQQCRAKVGSYLARGTTAGIPMLRNENFHRKTFSADSRN